jgi:hypothetical protein
VIGIGVPPSDAPKLEDAADPKQVHAVMRQARSARNTPAEPVASRRIRQRAQQKPEHPSGAQHGKFLSNICDDRVDTATDIRPSAQYFPPMRPPESGHGHVATHPKVQVVPDCDTRQRTARSLRRQSSMPPSMSPGMSSGAYTWPLYVLVAVIACVMAIALVRGLAVLSPKQHAAPTPGPSLQSENPGVVPLPSASMVHRPLDAGAATTAAAGASSTRNAPENASKAAPSARTTNAPSTSRDPTVF